SQLRRPLAAAVRRGGATAGTGLTGVAVVLRPSPAPVAQTAHHQRDRALLRGSATENPTYGVLCERRKCGPHHLLHLPEIQSGMENPHPQPIYTSSLTSPHRLRSCTHRSILVKIVLVSFRTLQGRHEIYDLCNRRTVHRDQGHRLCGRLPGGLHPSEEG